MYDASRSQLALGVRSTNRAHTVTHGQLYAAIREGKEPTGDQPAGPRSQMNLTCTCYAGQAHRRVAKEAITWIADAYPNDLRDYYEPGDHDIATKGGRVLYEYWTANMPNRSCLEVRTLVRDCEHVYYFRAANYRLIGWRVESCRCRT